ncbi:unnamed protein product [Rhizoctonia solani]|uniref:histone deacetylase n=1 Tax=Rhizoctonia solani TaxID=456999 RepID=A0A8H3BBG7_9AGAM|nr:unnamed protein product [Rhizoctonia solani]
MDSSVETSLDVQERVPYHRLRTGYCYDSAMTMHTQQGMDPDDPESEHHPEHPQRITCIRAILANNRLLERMQQIPIRQVRTNEVMLVHTRDLVDKVAGLESMTDEHIAATAQFYDQLSLYVTQATSQAAALSCGGVIECALAVAHGRVVGKQQFRDRPSTGTPRRTRRTYGILLLQQRSGRYARGIERNSRQTGFDSRLVGFGYPRLPFSEIEIRDVTGTFITVRNGTQLAFEDDPNVLYISIHRYDGGEFYPGGTYGSMNSVGLGAGKGKSVNIPWPEGHMGDADYMYAFLNIVMPIAYEFAPELVFISAGFDAAAGDTLGNCDVTPACYAHMTALLSTLAGGKLVVALEGGYNPESIAKSALAVTHALLGDPLPELPRLEASEIATEVVWQVARIQSQYWHCIQAPSLEPSDIVDETTIHLPELFKAWRREHALKDFGLYEFPWAVPELDDSYNGQLLVRYLSPLPLLITIVHSYTYFLSLTSENISTQHTLVMFVHDFGNISTELLTMKQLNIELENAWIIDTTRDFLKWCKSQQFSVIDLNMHPLIPKNEELPSEKERQETAKQAVISAWDNLAELSDAREIVIVAHGTAGLSVMGLIDERFQNFRNKVKAVVQVCGMHTIPSVPKFQTEIRKWYFRNSMVIIPKDHPIYLSDSQIQRKHGKVQQSTEERVTKVMRTSIPLIQQFITERVTPRSELVEGARRRAAPASASAPAPASQTYHSA